VPKESDAALEARIREQVIPLVSDHGGIPQLLWHPVYAWDLDSTVASTVHRRHLVEEIRLGGPATWDDYAMLCPDDTPLDGTVALMRELGHRGVHVVISGRSGLAEALTWQWFEKHDVPVAAALLRIHGDHTPNGEYKSRVLNAMRRLDITVRLFFEDWSEAAAEIGAKTGIPVVGINPFDPEEFPAKQGAI
jgi:hypothetical protein